MKRNALVNFHVELGQFLACFRVAFVSDSWAFLLIFILVRRRSRDLQTSRSTSWNLQNDTSGTGCPIDFVFDSRIGSSGMEDRLDLFPVVPNLTWPPTAILEISNDNISGTGRPINFVFGSMVGF